MSWRRGTKLKFIAEEDCDPSTRAVLRDIEETLGIPPVPLFFPALAAYAGFLPLMWKNLRPTVESHAFFHSAQRLRADAYTRVYNYLEIPDLWAQIAAAGSSSHETLAELVEMFHYRDSLLLLLFSFALQSMEGPAGKPADSARESVHPVYRHSLLLVKESAASAPVRKVLAEIRHKLQVPFVNTEYLALAVYPEFLSAYWEIFKRMLQYPLYCDWERSLRELAWQLAQELPGPVEIPSEQMHEAGLSDDDIASIMRIMELFIQNLSGLVLSMAHAKISLEGGNRSQVPRRPPSAEGGKPETGQPGRVA